MDRHSQIFSSRISTHYGHSQWSKCFEGDAHLSTLLPLTEIIVCKKGRSLSHPPVSSLVQNGLFNNESVELSFMLA